MPEFSFTRASALELLEKLERETIPPIVDARSLASEKERLDLMYELGKRELVEDLLLQARREEGS